MKRLLCTGVGGSAATNFIQSLRMAPEKFYIVGADSDKYHIKLSKADKNYLIPPYNSDEYIGFLNHIIEAEGIEFLHPQPDPEVLKIAQNKEKLKSKVFLPDEKVIKWCQDKVTTQLILGQKGAYSVPFFTEYIDARCFKGKKMWLRAKQGAGSLAALPVTTFEQADMWIKYWETRGLKREDFMLMDYLPGNEYAFQSVWYKGKLVTSATRQRLEYLFQNRMPSGQSSTPTVAKSVHNEEVNIIASEAIQMISGFKPHGVFCVDLKEDEDGKPCVTEINAGRFFTTSLFFTTAGSNMPYHYVKLGYGESALGLPQFNAVPSDRFWVRQIDCQQVMVKGSEL